MPLIVFPTNAGFERLKQLILLISREGASDPTLGAVKLNKILYFSDVRAYQELGESITSVRYQHLSEGPAPRALIPARKELEAEGAIELEPVRYLNRTQWRIKALTEPNLALFNEAQLKIVREIMEELRDYNASEVSELSHKEWGWKLTEDGEDIPMNLSWLSADPLTQEQEDLGRDLWAKLNART